MQARPLSISAARNLNPSGHISSTAEGPGLAHDAGNLLGALGLYCDLLDVPGVLRPEHLHYVRELRLLSQRSGALIDRLLAAPGASGRAGEKDSAAPGAAAVVRAFGPLLRALAAPDASVSMMVASNLPALPFAAEVLERILVNLARNAAVALRTHTPRDARGNRQTGRIRINVSGQASRLRLTVADNGPGMAQAAIETFMNPAPLPAGSRHGIGHRVIYDLLQAMGGKLSIKASRGSGTLLQVEWPILSGYALGRTVRAGGMGTC